MKFHKYGGAVKFIAVILFLLSLLAAFWSLLGVGYMVNEGYYRSGFSFSKMELSERVTHDYADLAFNSYFPLTLKSVLQPDEAVSLDYYKSMFSKEKTNFIFKIIGVNGTTVLSNEDDPSLQFQHTYFFSGGGQLPDTKYVMYCTVRDPLIANDNYRQPYDMFRTLSQARYPLIITACVTSLLSVCLFAYLMLAAGRRGSGGEIVTTWQHKIPADLFTAVLLLAGYAAAKVAVTLNLPGNIDYGFALMLPVSFVLFLFSFIALVWCMNIAVQLKKGILLHGTLIFRVLSFIVGIIRKLFNLLPIIWKSMLLFAGYLLINVILTVLMFRRGSSPGLGLLLLLFNGVVFLGLCFLMGQLRTLKLAGERIAAGDYASQVDTKPLLWDLKRHGDNLNNIVSGISCAVEERLKSERLKTELITNVSHDLKTPLTSIISYIDLLKKEPLQNETAEGYIAVLDRQSSRLRKLTEDLLEASKAATGNVSLSLGPIDLVELLNQSVGEYAERFNAASLETVFQTNSDTAVVYADGKLLWRIFDNLLNNICKYSLAGTRVYLSTDAGTETTTVTLRNISREALNIAPEELMERFVRGDASRSTEGSGLGLAIARSLTELLGGSFTLMLEGDLFKTVLVFKTLD